MYTLRNREPGLLPFNSIHHRYYRADSQVLSFFLYITAAAFYPHSVPLIPPIPRPPTRETHNRCTIIFVVKTGPSNHSAVISPTVFLFVCFICIPVGFGTFFLTELKIEFTSTFIHCRRQVPHHFQTTDLTFRRGGIATIYCIKMYTGFY